MAAKQVIEALYGAINRREVEDAIAQIDDDCLYEDFSFARPFRGKAAVRQLFEETCQNLPDGFRFVIDDITQGDPLAAGIIWHVELDGIPFPNGRGVSFYRLSPTSGQVIQARDVVESPLKPGKLAFAIIRLASPWVRRLLRAQITQAFSSADPYT